ncbi:MAG: hypothetical protein HGA22_10580, partial [Clostridiales bacterium]|nr:hypothetical protein [Clostridiales bacterium]
DFYNVLKAFKEKKGAEEPFILAATCVPNNNCLIGGYGVPGLMSSFPVSSEPFYQVDGKVKFGPVEAGFKEYLTMMNKWYNEGLVSKDFVSKNANIMDPNVEAAILNNKAGLWYNIQATIANLKLKAVDPKFEAAAIADPVKVAGDKIQIMNSSGLTSGGMCISTQCKNPELAVKWLDFWFSDTGAALANYGVEGKTYTVKDGKYEYTDLMVKNPDKMNLNEAQMKYTVSFLPTISVAKKNYVTYSDAQKAAPETWTSNKVNAYDLPLGMSVSTDESAEYSSIYNDIQTYTIEMMTKFIMGREPLSGFDQFAAKVKDMGIDKCIAIKQAALERYNKR